MPTYEYRCGACGHEFDVFQKMTDDPVRTCPECGEDEAERLISRGAGIVFKGSGFYATDYRAPPEKEREGAGGESGDAEAGSSGAKEADGKEHEGDGEDA